MMSSGRPRVSVIVPTYNSEDSVGECVDSVLGQAFKAIELICVDDGSSDGTRSLLESRAARDGRMKLVFQENAGPGVARNAALNIASGEFVYCLDADDYIARDMLSRCVGALDETGADIALVAFRTYNEQCRHAFPAEWGMRHSDVFPSHPHGAFSWRHAPELFFEAVQNVPWNKVVRKSLLDEHGIRFQELRLTEDLMYSLPAAVAAGRIVRLPRALVTHREFSGSNAMADKGRYPVDFLGAFEGLRRWLQKEGVYDSLRLAYQTWLLDAVYYNMPTYRDFEGFAAAFARLTADDLKTFDLADLRAQDVRDRRHRGMLEALQTLSRERFLLACSNIEAMEVQEQKCGFQDDQTSLKWLLTALRSRLSG